MSVGLASIFQLVTPSSLRARVRWEMPDRSSTRTKSSVSPSGPTVAPGLKTALTV